MLLADSEANFLTSQSSVWSLVLMTSMGQVQNALMPPAMKPDKKKAAVF